MDIIPPEYARVVLTLYSLATPWLFQESTHLPRWIPTIYDQSISYY